MPLNEAQGYSRSGLTRQQQREAMQAIYGVSMSPTELTYEERIKMRRMLDALDQKEAGGMKEFDLAKPPVAPYVFREFPYLMYREGTTRTAHNTEEREQMRAAGWMDDPEPAADEAGSKAGDPEPVLSKVNTSRTRK